MNIYLFLKKPILKIRSLYAKLSQLATDNLQILDAKMCRKFWVKFVHLKPDFQENGV